MGDPCAPRPDWRREVQRRAERAGVELPPSTIEELAQHLEDIEFAARADGASEAEARASAARALAGRPSICCVVTPPSTRAASARGRRTTRRVRQRPRGASA